MKTTHLLVLGTALLAVATSAVASVSFGYCGIVEQVVLEPAVKGQAERIQIFGVFVRYDDRLGSFRGIRPPALNGYLYFQMPENASPEQKALLRREWNDLAALAGTGQAVAFGSFAPFAFADTDLAPEGGSVEVRPIDAPPVDPAVYRSADVGLVKLGAGNLDYIVEALQNARSQRSSR